MIIKICLLLHLTQHLLKSIEGLPVLPAAPEAEKLTVEYLNYLKIPEPDALHIAIATVARNRISCDLEYGPYC